MEGREVGFVLVSSSRGARELGPVQLRDRTHAVRALIPFGIWLKRPGAR